MNDEHEVIGHPVIALARLLGCTEGQLYTLVTAIAIAAVLVLSGVHRPADAGAGVPITTPAPAASGVQAP